MLRTIRNLRKWFWLPIALLVAGLLTSGTAALPESSTDRPAQPPAQPLPAWQVEDLQIGDTGYGLSVFQGTQRERFGVRILGVLKNTSPGRDLVLAYLSGCNLEKTGVIAGMSGSPVYVKGKLVGAVAYAWAHGKEPICGITPYRQMTAFAELHDRPHLAADSLRVALAAPLRAGTRTFDSVVVSAGPLPASSGELGLVPLRAPLAASGFGVSGLTALQEQLGSQGVVPVQAGAAAATLLRRSGATAIEPGGSLSVALVSGDFDLSGIGTVTHVDGDRVYGWGHPFMSLGGCELPLMSGWVHTIYPRQTISFKMGSPLQARGTIRADVSTCIAGRLGATPDLLPVTMSVQRGISGPERFFQCHVVRQKSMMPQLVYSVLTNAVDMEGDLPEELTAEFEARIELEGRPTLVVRDRFSGPSFAGGRAPVQLYTPIAAMLSTLTTNPFQSAKVTAVHCTTKLLGGRAAADLEAVQLLSDTLAPGETLRVDALVKPYRQPRQRISLALPLPDDLPDGSYTATVCDDPAHVRQLLRDTPTLREPSSLEQVEAAVRLLAGMQRRTLVVRVALPDAGVALDGQALPDLPASMVEMLANGRRTGGQAVGTILATRQPTEWVVQGSQQVKFTVSRSKRVTVALP